MFPDFGILSDEGEAKIAEVFVQASRAAQSCRSCHGSKIGESILIERFNKSPFNAVARHWYDV